MNGSANDDAEWVEIVEPQSHNKMFANLETGECCWEAPIGARLRRKNDRQWWELFDSRTNRYYYYNAKSKETVWQKPQVDASDIIPLSKLQNAHPSRESQTQTNSSSLSSSSSAREEKRASRTGHHTPRNTVYAQDISAETGLVTVRESPDPISASFKAMSLDRRMDNFLGGHPIVGIEEKRIAGGITIALDREHYGPPSPVEQSYDTPSSISRNRFPYDSSSPTRSLDHAFLDEDGVSIGEVWSKDAPKAPLADPANKTLKKEAAVLFKHIQSYMGDRKTKNIPDQLALTICESASKVDVADETCLLLMKQLTRNERPESLRRGWELLAIVLALSVPSKKVMAQLGSFAERHADSVLDPPGVKVHYFAAQVQRRLAKTTARPRPTLTTVQEARIHIYNPPQFGARLEDLMEMQTDRFPHLRVPWIEQTLVDLVLNAGGSATEGIFRVAADPEQLSTAKARLDLWLVPALSDAHVAACLLKAWLRELPDPLIPSTVYERALNAGEKPEEACHIASLLPQSNALVLARLIRLLQTLAKDECVALTKMDASNLAMVIAPNVLRCESEDPRVLYENTRREMAFIRTLIIHYDTTFAL